MSQYSLQAVLVASLLLIFSFCNTILSPLLYDSLNPTSSEWIPTSGNDSTFINISSSTQTWRRVDPIFALTVSMGFDVVVLGFALLFIKLCRPSVITDRERLYPKKYFLMVGGFQAISGVIWQYSASGLRIAPYLQPIIGSCSVPIVFINRFLILRRRPTLIKLACAVSIVVAVLVSLLPTVISGLETDAQKKEDGGATGAWRIIWPIMRVASAFPGALSVITLERTMKDEVKQKSTSTTPDEPTSSQDSVSHNCESEERYSSNAFINASTSTAEDTVFDREIQPNPEPKEKTKKLNAIYALFWTYFATCTCTASLFWADLIPGFGLVTKPSLLGKQLLFNTRCVVGAEPECGLYTVLLFWGRMMARTTQFVCNALLLRYGEGANYNIIVGLSVTPITVLFWTLFDEQPFRWHPHVSISTWLSIAALAVIVPAIAVYNFSAPEVIVRKKQPKDNEDTEPLL